MKISIIQMLIIFIFLSCAKESTPSKTPENESKNSIEGSWKLVYADIKENDSLQIKDLSQTDFIKIINGSHFAFFNQDKGTSENFMAGAGTYTFNGSDYAETLDFINAPDYRGHVFPFKVEIKGDSLIQQGHEKIEAAGLDRYILEKYIRINPKN
jgi:hypothetical protein